MIIISFITSTKDFSKTYMGKDLRTNEIVEGKDQTSLRKTRLTKKSNGEVFKNKGKEKNSLKGNE